MSVQEILTLIGLILVWSTTLVGFWIRVKIKLKELEMMINSNRIILENKINDNQDDLNKHVIWGENQQAMNNDKFKEIVGENKVEHKEIANKLDGLINTLNDFKVDMAKNR